MGTFSHGSQGIKKKVILVVLQLSPLGAAHRSLRRAEVSACKTMALNVLNSLTCFCCKIRIRSDEKFILQYPSVSDVDFAALYLIQLSTAVMEVYSNSCPFNSAD